MAGYGTPEAQALSEKITTEVLPNGLAVLTIENPRAFNACDELMVRTIREVLAGWHASSEVKAVLLQGSGGRAFCGGGDVKAIQGRLKADPKSPAGRDIVYSEYNLLFELRQMAKPSLSLMEGVVMGFGLGLAGFARYRIACETSRLAMPENNIGIFPDVGFAYQAANLLPPGLGRTMALTGGHLMGIDDALRSKLATHAVASEDLPKLREALRSADLSDADAGMLACVEAVAAKTPEPGQIAGNGELLGRIAGCQDARAAVDALEASAAADKDSWASKLVEFKRTGSPFSQAVAWRLVSQAEREAGDCDGGALEEPGRLAAALERDYATMCRMINEADFLEGVRAVLVDKDRNAKWSTASLEDVSDDVVAATVAPLPAVERRLGLPAPGLP